jgi:Na+/H+ antiporter NhaD/arsenite permease-like protein
LDRRGPKILGFPGPQASATSAHATTISAWDIVSRWLLAAVLAGYLLAGAACIPISVIAGSGALVLAAVAGKRWRRPAQTTPHRAVLGAILVPGAAGLASAMNNMPSVLVGALDIHATHVPVATRQTTIFAPPPGG